MPGRQAFRTPVSISDRSLGLVNLITLGVCREGVAERWSRHRWPSCGGSLAASVIGFMLMIYDGCSIHPSLHHSDSAFDLGPAERHETSCQRKITLVRKLHSFSPTTLIRAHEVVG